MARINRAEIAGGFTGADQEAAYALYRGDLYDWDLFGATVWDDIPRAFKALHEIEARAILAEALDLRSEALL